VRLLWSLFNKIVDVKLSSLKVVSKSYQVLARKWRPRQFTDVVGQTHVVRALTNALTQNYLHHAYLFTGTRGVGKTTIARILAKCLNCESGVTAQPCGTCSHCQEIDSGRFVDLLEVDAASRTKVEDTRDLLDNVQYSPAKGRFKVYLIDEVHMLSGHSFNALLKTLEEPPAHVKFLLATTDPQKLPATVLSRCLQFHLSALQPEQISAHCQAVLTQEQIEFETEATQLLAKAAEGSLRDALSLLDQSIAFGNGKVLAEDVKNMLGTIDTQILYQILQALASQDAAALIAHVAQLAEQGADFNRALADLLSLLHQIAVVQAVPESSIDGSLRELAAKISREDIQLYYQIGILGQRDLPWAPSLRSGFEMTVLRMLAFLPQEQAAETTQAEPVKASQVKPVSAPPLKPSVNPAWADLLPQLGLDGATKILANHCAFQELTQTQLKLRLHTRHQPLLNQKHIERINEAVSKYYGRPMTVVISLGTEINETPADLARRQQESQQQAAEQAILSDPVVQHVIQNFDASVIKASIHAKKGAF
jgi:DNA polymerase III subunit gamma/tau